MVAAASPIVMTAFCVQATAVRERDAWNGRNNKSEKGSVHVIDIAQAKRRLNGFASWPILAVAAFRIATTISGG